MRGRVERRYDSDAMSHALTRAFFSLAVKSKQPLSHGSNSDKFSATKGQGTVNASVCARSMPCGEYDGL